MFLKFRNFVKVYRAENLLYLILLNCSAPLYLIIRFSFPCFCPYEVVKEA